MRSDAYKVGTESLGFLANNCGGITPLQHNGITTDTAFDRLNWDV
jgi:hypothetical protein